MDLIFGHGIWIRIIRFSKLDCENSFFLDEKIIRFLLWIKSACFRCKKIDLRSQLWWRVDRKWGVFLLQIAFFQSCLEAILKLFGYYFLPSQAHTWVQYRAQFFLMNTKIMIFWWNNGLCDMVVLTNFETFHGKKNRFFEFLRVVL